MAIESQWVEYGAHTGYLAWPEKAEQPLPAVLVIQEIWGVGAHIEDVTRRLAAAGYAALAPDLYARNGERPEALSRERVLETQRFMDGVPREAWSDAEARGLALAALEPGRQARIGETFAALYGGLGTRTGEFVDTLRASVRHLREIAEQSCGQRVASVGFCMGGGLSALLACDEPELSGAVLFYGASPPLERVPGISCPVLGLYGGLDERITGGVAAFAQAMKEAGKDFEHHVYEGAQHGFFNDGRGSYDVKAARDGFVRALEFFRKTIG